MTIHQVISYLNQDSLFAELDSEDYLKVAGQFRHAYFQKDEIIFKEGDPGDKIYFLVQGEACVLKKMHGGERNLKLLQAGECFGEMALISRDNRSATVKAITDAQCLVMTAADFFQLIDEDKHFGRRMMRILSARLTHAEEMANIQILNSYQSLFYSLSSLAESRDPETGAHLNRVRNHCRLLADLLTNNPQFSRQADHSFAENLYMVTPLHDIGKVAIPDRILQKPGKLTREEFEIMKTHTTIGAETIKKVMESCHHPIFEMAYNVVHYHHEHYSGNGYPTRLAGEDIPMEARIMALADVFDALMSRRVYKEPMTITETCGIIREGAGRQFDPKIAEIFLANVHEFEKIHRQYHD
jgi:response regulator RpfG family c-di-GMP phosphodiesterase